MHAVTVETTANASVLRLLIGMAIGARLRRFRRRMRAVALQARLATVRFGMALHAALLRLALRRTEVVTVATRGRRRIAMQRCRDGRMTSHAELEWWRFEAVGVALVARDLADVNRVTRARPNIFEGGRDLLGRHVAHVSARTEHDQHDE
jgi:hypothetical protein